MRRAMLAVAATMSLLMPAPASADGIWSGPCVVTATVTTHGTVGPSTSPTGVKAWSLEGSCVGTFGTALLHANGLGQMPSARCDSISALGTYSIWFENPLLRPGTGTWNVDGTSKAVLLQMFSTSGPTLHLSAVLQNAAADPCPAGTRELRWGGAAILVDP